MPKNKIVQFFDLSRKYLSTYLGISISVFLFVLFFQPFTTELFEFENRLLFFAGFGLICLIFLFIVQILFQNYLLQTKNNGIDNSLTVSFYNFLIVSLCSLAFVFYIRYVGQIEITFTLAIRAIVISTMVAYTMHSSKALSSWQNKYKSLLIENKNMHDQLKQFSEIYTHRFIEFVSENESDNFKVLVSEIVFLKSADNYVEIGYREDGEVKKKMIRNTLKNVEQQLKEYHNFIRTHRASIVNIQNIEKLYKNFNTYWLSIQDSKETVPVSRQYLIAVKDMF
jgi:DNA-binding LytR/AlgR family response regulator